MLVIQLPKLFVLYLALLSLYFLSLVSDVKALAPDEKNSVRVPVDRPNIIYILADDAGYGDLSSYGQKNFKTPNLDQMAAEGMKFTQHYAGSTVCAPSRSVLLTGLHGGRTQIRDNYEVMPVGQLPLRYGTVTLPKVLQGAGYKPGMFGKWGLGYPDSEGEPALQGFDEFLGFICQRRSHFFYPEYIYKQHSDVAVEKFHLEGNIVHEVSRENFQRHGSGPAICPVQYSQDVIMEHALEFIGRHGRSDSPFFLYIPSQIPHASLEVPDKWIQLFLDENGDSIFEEDTSHNPGGYTRQDKPMAAYAAMMTLLDDYVGRILEKLDGTGLAENTLVIFTSDNGSYSEGGYHYAMHQSNGVLRGGKRDLYEGGIRVPMIARWTGVVPAGVVSDHISAFDDMLPTFAELAGVTVPPGLDGVSMVPELLGQHDLQSDRPYLYWEFHPRGGHQAVRSGAWKAIRMNVRNNSDSHVELYNLSEDLSEKHNVAADHPEIVKEMLGIMSDAHIPSHQFPLFK